MNPGFLSAIAGREIITEKKRRRRYRVFIFVINKELVLPGREKIPSSIVNDGQR